MIRAQKWSQERKND